jgi:putative ABC transport system substrate-binding protein
LGWTSGHNVHIGYRFAAGSPENYRKYAAELVALAPDVILAPGGSLAYVLQATRTVPIVFAFAADPVGSGFVESVAAGRQRDWIYELRIWPERCTRQFSAPRSGRV